MKFNQGHALIIGVGADLPNTVDDAVALAGLLRDPARCAYPPEQVHLLAGERATRDAFLSALDALARSTNPRSTVVVCFSGHGCRVASPVGMGKPPTGAGRFIALLVEAGLPVLPVGVMEA